MSVLNRISENRLENLDHRIFIKSCRQERYMNYLKILDKYNIFLVLILRLKSNDQILQ
jgi:hypothetical protein